MLLLNLSALEVRIGKKAILNGCSLQINEGTIHVLMGPNGAGKSSLAYAIMGYPSYPLKNGSIFFQENDITTIPMYQRSRLGIFLALQNPPALEGVPIISFLKEIVRIHEGDHFVLSAFYERVRQFSQLIDFSEAFLERSVNEGFSGGEKKRLALLQMLLLNPFFAILDEIDSGLDVDSVMFVVAAISYMRKRNPSFSCLFITHGTNLIKHLSIDAVHLMKKGQITKSGLFSFVYTIDEHGYK